MTTTTNTPYTCRICLKIPTDLDTTVYTTLGEQCCVDSLFCWACACDSAPVSGASSPSTFMICSKCGRSHDLEHLTPLTESTRNQLSLAKCQWCSFEKAKFLVSEHEANECPRKIVACELDCGTLLSRESMHVHLTNHCNNRTLKCAFCSMEIRAHEEEKHLENACPETLIVCSNANRGCGMEVKRSKLIVHLENECEFVPLPCPFFEVGCQHQSIENEMDKHLQESLSHHLLLSNASLKNRVDMLSTQLAQCEQRLSQTEAQLSTKKHLEVLEATRSDLVVPKLDQSRGGGGGGYRLQSPMLPKVSLFQKAYQLTGGCLHIFLLILLSMFRYISLRRNFAPALMYTVFFTFAW
eukprot:CAMPEP_0201551378 /NCGR_PEP_ID=MMETSP0173_2-20130828/7564_1 /ASSEMBLY_ACC=CAM_ASM_000268 /TAXON_ID=218659 /ORGANISM="Vexillifera sp., Strain DIVA3 564/2" /LENGTH=353 /DNA_ID=CAMNT_0047961609 /DNA_START=49 /DNA_END=1107 /DNA_ORIENTATION=+